MDKTHPSPCNSGYLESKSWGVLHILISEAQKCVIVPTLKHYKSVQIDEFWSYVGHKRRGSVG
jgi:hypothetical protein